jgi:hypothetical protein
MTGKKAQLSVDGIKAPLVVMDGNFPAKTIAAVAHLCRQNNVPGA